MIAVIFARSKADAPSLQFDDYGYADRNFNAVSKHNHLLYIQPGRIGHGGLFALHNAFVLVASDNVARVNQIFGTMNLAPIARLFH